MSNKRGLFWIITGLLLVVAALSLTGYNLLAEQRSASGAEDILRQMEAEIQIPTTETSLSAAMPAGPEIPTQPATSQEAEIPDFLLNPEMEMPVMQLDGIDYIGLLQIPALNLTLPIASQWSYNQLLSTPCRYTGSAYTGNLVLVAHNYDSHFGRLKDLPIGEMVFFTDADENTFIYEVSAKETLLPTAVEEMTDGSWPLTLFTCTLGGANRFTIRCEQVGVNY